MGAELAEQACQAFAGALGTQIAKELGVRIDLSRVTVYLTKRVQYLKGWCMQQPTRIDLEPQGSVRVEILREKIKTIPIPDKAIQVTVEGTFFPAVLLYSGWWERERSESPRRPKWHDDLQAWLFNGFEQWGPSWDINPGEGEAEDLFGQIGEGDEANSLPVIIPAAKAKRLWDKLLSGAEAFDVKATGWLCHRQHLDQHLESMPKLQRQIAAWGKTFDFCLLLSAGDSTHRITPQRGTQASYSGYLWQCWSPREWLDTAGSNEIFLKPPQLNKIYFLWEHTDFRKSDAIAYNIDSLRHKAKYLEKQHGELVLLQKSSKLVPGDPKLPEDVFYSYITH